MWRNEDPARWSRLAADLDAWGDSLVRVEEYVEVADRTRIEVGGLTLADRLSPALGQEVDVRCLGVGLLRGRLDRVGPDWLELAGPSGPDSLVPLSAVVAVAGLARWSAVEDTLVSRRLGLRSVLRRLGHDRMPVRLVLTDGGALAGTIDRVGADFVELAEHAPGELRRADSVRRVWTLPLAAVAVIRSASS